MEEGRLENGVFFVVIIIVIYLEISFISMAVSSMDAINTEPQHSSQQSLHEKDTNGGVNSENNIPITSGYINAKNISGMPLPANPSQMPQFGAHPKRRPVRRVPVNPQQGTGLQPTISGGNEGGYSPNSSYSSRPASYSSFVQSERNSGMEVSPDPNIQALNGRSPTIGSDGSAKVSPGHIGGVQSNNAPVPVNQQNVRPFSSKQQYHQPNAQQHATYSQPRLPYPSDQLSNLSNNGSTRSLNVYSDSQPFRGSSPSLRSVPSHNQFEEDHNALLRTSSNYQQQQQHHVQQHPSQQLQQQPQPHDRTGSIHSTSSGASNSQPLYMAPVQAGQAAKLSKLSKEEEELKGNYQLQEAVCIVHLQG